jgi:hypothetical protein
VKIYEPKLGRKSIYGGNFESDFQSFEKVIDEGSFNPEYWDIVMHSYIKKRSNP